MTEIKFSSEEAALRDRIAQAVFDPGSILPRLNRDDPEKRESISRWSTRAVMQVLVASGWRRETEVLRTEAPSLLRLLKAAIAYEIRAELVCCDIYEQLSKERDERRWRTEMTQGHHLCYWGEAAARIAESHELGSEAEQYVSAGTRTDSEIEYGTVSRADYESVAIATSGGFLSKEINPVFEDDEGESGA